MNYKKTNFLFLMVLFFGVFGFMNSLSAATQRLQVSDNGHYLEKEDGTPFFWMGDTAWSLVTVAPSDVVYYLEDRRQRGFNIIHVDADAYSANNYSGVRPFINDNTDTPNESWWQHVDYIVNQADLKGIYICLFPMWGSVWDAETRSSFGGYRIFNNDADKAYRFGKWLGSRYKDKNNLIWSVAGEYNEIFSAPYSFYNNVALGIRAGGATHLMTIHPGSVNTSSTYFHSSSWLGFNMLQTFSDEVYTFAPADFSKSPTKPVLSAEQKYEFATSSTVVRRGAYWAVFSGTFGFTYGHMIIQTMLNPLEGGPHSDWKNYLSATASNQMKHLRSLMESLPFTGGIPDQTIITSSNGIGYHHLRATRDVNGTYSLIYIPDGSAVTVNMAKIIGGDVSVSWYNPQNGAYTAIGTYANTGTRSFDAPGSTAEGNDWVLVLKRVASTNTPPAASITNPSADGVNVTKNSTLNFSGTISDSDNSSLTYSWYIDRLGDGFDGALVKSGTQGSGSVSGTLIMSGTKLNPAGQAINLETVGATYNLSLKVSDGVNTEINVIRSFILIDISNAVPAAPTGVRVI